MAENIDLRSSRFLYEARDTLNVTALQIGIHAESAREMVRIAQQHLQLIGQARREELRDAQYALDSVDEDDDGWDERVRRDEAYEAVQRFRRVAESIDDAGRQFIARTGHLTDRGKRLAQAGIASLDHKIDAVDEYTAIRVPDPLSQTGGDVVARVCPQGQPMTIAGVASACSESQLPPGFAWINISEIDPNGGFVDDPAEFRKASHAQLLRGVEILRDEIIPAIEANGRYTREDAERCDREGGTDYTEAGWIHPESRLAVWQAFLDPRREADVVAVERGPDGKYRVSSGRHRLGVARQLGLRTIPGRILGGPNGA